MSHEADRVYLDVDGAGVAAGGVRGLAERHLDERAEARAAAGLEKDLDAVLAAQARERGGRGAEDAAGALGVGAVERAAQHVGRRLHAREVVAVDEQRGERDEWRVAQTPSVVDLLLEEALVVLRAGVAQGVVARVVGLYEHATGETAAPRAPGDLRDELEGALGRAEVGHREPRVHRDDADQRHVREVVALGYHLRADEHVELARGEAEDGLLVGRAARGRVAVEPRDADGGEALLQNLLYLLGALADEEDEGAFAGGARVGRAAAQVAVVADEAALVAVVGERDLAVVAVDALAARAAEHEARIAAAVEEDDCLLAARVRLLDG